MISNDEFRQKVFDFIKTNKISPTSFGEMAKNDPSFVRRLEKGQEVKESGKKQVLEFMENYKAGVKEKE